MKTKAFKKLTTVILGLILTVPAAFAQYPVELPGPKFPRLPDKPGSGGVIRQKNDPMSALPSGYRGYEDVGLEELNQKMKEKDWGSEDTAWKRAVESNTSRDYERYMAIYPYGAHVSEAATRLVRVRVTEILDSAHNDLPNIKQTEEDEDSPTSIIEITNNTGMSLTVYCSGEDTKSVVIAPDKKMKVKVKNGPYKLAASVPPEYVRPFAGQTSFHGGTYEIGFWIVSR